MIIFYTDNFELDLSTEKITFIEENSLFYDYFLRSHSLPFSFTLDDDLLKKLGFMTDYNARPETLRFDGKLLKNDTFENAYLIISSQKGRTLQGSLYYGKASLPLLETPLSELPFTEVSTTNITTHALDIIDKHWPETTYNFPMIIDKEFGANSDYEAFRGFKNLYENGAFVNNIIYNPPGTNEYIPSNYNIMTPCIYLVEILKVGFESANMIIRGDLINDLAFHKLVYDPENHLDDLRDDGVNYFQDSFSLSDFVPKMTFGAYLTKLKNWLNLDISFRKNIVTINYIEKHFKDIEFVDAKSMEIPLPRITPSTNKIYQLTYRGTNKIYVNRSGIITSPDDFTEKKEISMGISLLKQTTHDNITTAEKRKSDEDFRVLLYDGLQSGSNVAVEEVYSRTFSLNEVYDRFWKKWLAFRLNSKTFRSTFKVNTDRLSVKDGIHNYNNNHLIKKITKRKEGRDLYNVTIETETVL